ncbi:MAG: hypothetical protein AABO57_01515 [Acidobacteriota bacterium]
MKTCPVCALDMEDTYLFCPDDGSSLGTRSSGSSENAAIASEVPAEVPAEIHAETAAALVLYCPTCASEYPLTFSECPMHGVPLTKHHIPRLSNKERAATVELPSKQTEATLSNRLTRLNLTRPQIEKPHRAAPVAAEVATGTPVLEFDYPQLTAGGSSEESDSELFYPESLTEVQERGFERPGFRVAAIATVLALAVFALVAIYALVSNLSRRPSPAVVRVASATEAAVQPSPFIPTPQEAQDYRDEQPSPVASTPPAEQPPERKSNEGVSASATERSARSSTAAQPGPKPGVVTPPQPPVTTTKVSTSPMPALPRGSSGGFDSRLIRVRSRKTPSGFRYDLTFNMLEQANRAAQWQRVLIATRSASGMSHSEAIPFVHRLGATGALTFTISVELTGRSEADWQGRVVCTTLGWDNKGAPLQAIFGANLTP